LTPPIEKPGTRENRARVRSLSLPGFSRLSQARLSFSFSLSRCSCRLHRHPVFFSFFVLLAPTPPRTRSLLISLLPRLPFSDETTTTTSTSTAVALAPRSLSLLSPCPPCSFVPPAFLPLLRCRFHRNTPLRTPTTPENTVRDDLLSSPLLLPRVLPLATLTACVTRRGIRRPGRNLVIRGEAAKPGKKRRKRGTELRDGGASSDIRFYKERAGILEGSQGWSAMKVEEPGR